MEKNQNQTLKLVIGIILIVIALPSLGLGGFGMMGMMGYRTSLLALPQLIVSVALIGIGLYLIIDTLQHK